MGYTDSSLQVLYIMGCARSGSTVMDSILGNHPDIASVGELSRLPYDGWLMNRICACGRPAHFCEFWSDVRSKWTQRTNIINIDNYLDAERRLGMACRKLNGFNHPDTKSLDFRFYVNSTEALYQAIQEVSGKSIIVDSSKDPLRAFLITMIPGIDLKIIHLVRDSRGVIWSFRKSFSKSQHKGVEEDVQKKPVWKTGINWLRINLLATSMCNLIDERNATRIQYEQFVAHPREVLATIGKMINVEMSALSDRIENGREMAIGHIIAGNRLRLNGSIRLHLDEEWKGGLSVIDKKLAWLITGSLMQTYGYVQ